MTPPYDQRLHPRVNASFVVRLRGPGGTLTTRTVDASVEGFFVACDEFLPVNQVVQATIEIPGLDPIPATIRVAYVRDAAAATESQQAGMGLEIVDASTDLLNKLQEHLAGETPRPTLQVNATPSVAPPTASSGLVSSPPPEQAAAAMAAPISARLVEGRLKVVVVDDDPSHREFAAAPFRERGDEVRLTSDGLEALSMCLKDPPDIILTDLQMPRMDGWQLLRLIRCRPSLASVPVIFLTGLNDDAERLRGYQFGVDSYIEKPYQAAELLARVQRIVKRAQTAHQSSAMRTTLRGELEHVGPGSLLSFLEMDRKTGLLLIVGESVGRVFVREGRVMTAEIEGTTKSAKEALGGIINWRSGQFEFSVQDVTSKDELQTGTTAFLLEHAKFEDES